jgi:NADH:ubiquinone oxidoreductase subunit F (NADH-binding)
MTRTDTLADLLDAAGLAGRGGAAFSTATKVRAAHAHDAHLVVNACDGEIGAAKDGWVVENHLPELVHGATLLAAGRRRGVLFAAHRGSRTAAVLAAAGLDVLETPPRYVSSEESALVSLAQGGLARPMTKRLPVVAGGRDSRGARVRPTLVLNAETVWRVAQIAERGPGWFRSSGTSTEPGPRLVSVSGYVASQQVRETEAGVSVVSLLDAAGGLHPEAPAVLVGGLGGAFLTPEEARRLRWSRESLGTVGAAVGPGVLIVLDPWTCPLETVAQMLRYAAGESAGQCGPCMFGLPAVAREWDDLVSRPSRAGEERVRRRLELLPDRGACRFPDGVGRFTASALRVLGSHLAGHGAGACGYPSTRSVPRAAVG